MCWKRRLDTRRTEQSSPFCLVVSYHHPHDPFHVTQRDWDVYADTDIPIPHYPDELDQTYSTMDRWANAAHETDRYDVTDPDSLRRLRHAYYASLTFVDRMIGELIEELAASGELDRTVIIFCSDHGDMLGERGMVQKRSFYEHSVRVPLLVRLPDGSAAGTRNGTPVSLIDVLPTMLDLAGVAEDGRAPIDGTSMVPLLAGARQERVVFWRIPPGEGVRALLHGAPGPLQVRLYPWSCRSAGGRPAVRPGRGSAGVDQSR